MQKSDKSDVSIKSGSEEDDPWAMDSDEADRIGDMLGGFEEDGVLCCCKHDVPHSEDMKFILMT